ncbi:MAG TPA: ABC transporter substrate-binding protein [Acidimicrobiales bacterium]|nr:ABC transporter substrate-binding protein [Acidimicrobiales bacterium]
MLIAALLVPLTAACSSSAKTASTPPTTGSSSSMTTGSGSTSTLPAKYATSITVALDASYPPDEFLQSGQISGFDVDLINALAQQMGTHAKLVNATFDGIIPGLQSGKYDLGDSSFTDTKAREQQVDFVDYFSSGEGFYQNANSTAQFDGLSSLCNHSVSVEAGTTEETDAKTQAGKCKVTVLSFSDQNQANLAVSSGRADVGFADSQVAGYIVKQSSGQFKLVGQPFATAPYGLAVPKNSGLAQPLLAAVQALMSNGTYNQILTKWGVQGGAVTSAGINGATS